MKFRQLKYWCTRRIHLFETRAGEEEMSLCGLAIKCGCYPHRGHGYVDWPKQNKAFHPYDDLNFCQSCRRKAMKIHKEQYKPLAQKYTDPRIGEKS